MPRLLCASHVFPMADSALRDGAVVIEGTRVAAIGPAKKIIPQFPGAEICDYGSAVILPGLVNAHVHLELSDLRSAEFSGENFIEWLGQIVRKTTPG